MASQPEDLFREALDHHSAGRLVQASEVCQQLLQIEPDHADVWYLSGVIALQTGQPAQAVERLRRALAIAADRPQYYNILGLSLMAMGASADAEAAFRRAIALDDSPPVPQQPGRTALSAGTPR